MVLRIGTGGSAEALEPSHNWYGTGLESLSGLSRSVPRSPKESVSVGSQDSVVRLSQRDSLQIRLVRGHFGGHPPAFLRFCEAEDAHNIAHTSVGYGSGGVDQAAPANCPRARCQGMAKRDDLSFRSPPRTACIRRGLRTRLSASRRSDGCGG